MSLGETEYNGTLSPLTRYGTMLTSHQHDTGKRRRGKSKVNKRQPRVRGAASECVSYHLDKDGNKVNGKVFRVARERNVSKGINVDLQNKLDERKVRTAADLKPQFAD